MTTFLLAQTAAPNPAADPELRALIVRYLQQGLWSPPYPGIILTIFLGWVFAYGLATYLMQRDFGKWSWGVFDIRGHFAHFSDGMEALRFNKRPVWVILACGVLSWSVWLLLVWNENEQLSILDQMLARANNSAIELSIVHAFVSSLEPYRDLTSQSSLIALAIGASLVMFVRTPELSNDLRTGLPQSQALGYRQLLGGMWICVVMCVTLRCLLVTVHHTEAPLSANFLLEGFFLALLQIPTDGLLFAWLLGELAAGLRGRSRWSEEDSTSFVKYLIPASLLCVLMNPARYIVLGWISFQVRFGTGLGSSEVWGNILTSAAGYSVLSLTLAPIPALMVARRATRWSDLCGEYGTLMRQCGGRVFAILLCAVLLKITLLTLIFWIFTGMQPETWTLLGANSYGHYASLLLDILLLTALCRLIANQIGISEQRVVALVTDLPAEEVIELPLAETPVQ